MRTVTVVQARIGSTRLPAKVLADLGGAPLVERVLDRVSRAASVDETVLAIPAGDADEELAALATRLGYRVVRGPDADVLERYRLAAVATDADVVVRVTADCPFIDPALVDDAVERLREDADDYVSNGSDGYLRGLDVEVMTRDALERAAAEATVPYERAHVTAYIWSRPEAFRIGWATWERDYSAYRWTVDTPADLEFARAVWGRLADPVGSSWRTILATVDADPALQAMNAHVVQKALEDG